MICIPIYLYKRFIITIEMNRIEAFNWVKRPFSRMGVVTLNRAHNKNRHDSRKKIIFLDSPFTKHFLNRHNYFGIS